MRTTTSLQSLICGALVFSVGSQVATPQEGSFTVGGLQFSHDDLENQEKITHWATQAFYSQVRLDTRAWGEVMNDLAVLGRAAADLPALSLGVGMALYSYFWWEDARSVRVNVQAGRDAAALFHRSILYNGCDSASLPLQDFYMRQCHVRWRYLLMIASEVGRYAAIHLRDMVLAAAVLQDTSSHLRRVRELPFFRRYEEAAAVARAVGVGMVPGGSQEVAAFRKPHSTNFNQDFFPHILVGPVWPKDAVPLAAFLEAHYLDFLGDLRGFLDDKTFWDLHFQNQNAETQFGPRDDDWQTVYLVRNREWNELNCRHAPHACQLLRQRPEIAGCAMGGAGAGFLRLRPGARLKPHFGNAPRMSAHLGLIVPESGDIHMRVGDQLLRWEEGKAIVFDDTFIHSVVHDGTEPRFVLNVWFCHPCDAEHLAIPVSQLPSFCASPFS